MCEICLHGRPHLPACPEAAPSHSNLFCNVCKEEIQPGVEYADVCGDYICEYCLDDMTRRELVEFCGGEICAAGRESS
jgi:hypothetical protein